MMTSRQPRIRPIGALLLACVLLSPASFVSAQPGAAQDSTRNNLVHAPDYVPADPGALGAIVERGEGPIDMVLVSGFGLGASAFEGFMERNRSRYRMWAVTLPGFEGTAAPPMPPPGTSYGDQSWTRAAIEAVVRLIQEKGLARPVIVGHFINGTQVAMRIGFEHPDLVRAVVLLAGTPRYEPVATTPYWPKDLTPGKKVEQIDRYMAPLWFKTVTRDTWENGNFTALDYSTDSTLGKRFADRANEPPLPVLIRYLCEFHASDLWPDLDRLVPPLLLLQPAFTEAARADSTRNYLQGYFEEPWRGRLEDPSRTKKLILQNAGIMVMEDQARTVDEQLASFLWRVSRSK